MSTPRDRDGDAFDDGRTDGPAGWQEPAHLGSGDDGRTDDGRSDDGRSDDGRSDDGGVRPQDPAGATSWQPPGWELPAVEPDGPSAPPWQPPVADQRTDAPPPDTGRRRGLLGSRSPQPPPARDEAGYPVADPRIMVPPADPWGTQAWALSVGWVLSDGTAPEAQPLAALLQTAPVRPGKDDRPARVLRGRGNGLDLVAFDIASPLGRETVSTHAVTAAPVLGAVPAFRLSPARLWRHGTGGLLQVPSPDPEFDRRWVLLAAEDGPQVRRLVEDPLVRQLLLGSDDGDELWSAVGFVAAVRPDANRPQLIEHHARLLAAVVGALATAA